MVEVVFSGDGFHQKNKNYTSLVLYKIFVEVPSRICFSLFLLSNLHQEFGLKVLPKIFCIQKKQRTTLKFCAH